MQQLTIARELKLPVEAVTQTFAILAKRGMGKTYTASVMTEEMLKAGQTVVVVDPVGVWWGLRSSATGRSAGLPIVVLGGDHGDVPLEETAGEVIADLVVDSRTSLVLDLSHFRKAASVRFMTDFAERLYQRNRQALHVMVDEADAFAPQRPQRGTERLLGAIEDLVRRGRARGIGLTLVTQRPAVLNKNVLTQVEVLVALRVVSPQDREALDAWIRQHADEADRDAFLTSLASLPIGTAWFWSPGWLELFQRVKVRRRETFDSSATPDVAGGTAVSPAAMATVDLDALQQRMAATIERAKADDPKALRRRLKELEAKLAQQPEPERIVETIEVPVIGDEQLQQLRALADELGALANDVAGATQALTAAVQRVIQQPARAPARTPAPAPPRPRATPREPAMSPSGDEPALKAGAGRILEALARHHPMTFTKAQVGTLTGFKITGGTFQTYWGVLKRAGYVIEENGEIRITDAGLERAGVVPEAPATTTEMLEMWSSRLKRGAREMLQLLADTYPGSIGRDELAEQLDMTASGGTFQTYLGTLRRNGLADIDGGMVRASDTLFIGAQ